MKAFTPLKKGALFILCLMIVTLFTGCSRLSGMLNPNETEDAVHTESDTVKTDITESDIAETDTVKADPADSFADAGGPPQEISPTEVTNDSTDTPTEEQADSETGESQTFSDEGRNALLLNADTGDILYERNANDQIAPASTTKMLTALTVLANCSEDQAVTVGEEIQRISEDSSIAWLEIGDELTIRQLLVALMLPSGNDAAYTLAVFTGRQLSNDQSLPIDEAVAVFIDAMNARAAEIGAESSHFLAPDGYDVEGQYTTASDLAQIAIAYMANPTLAEIAGSTRISDTWLSGREVTYENSNAMLYPDSPYYNENVTGLKTGSSDDAGACLVSSASLQGQNYICVVMGSTSAGRFEESLELYNSITE